MSFSADGTQTISVTGLDLAGNQTTISTSVTVDTTPPSLVAISPAPGSTVNSLTFQFQGTASEPLSSATLNGQPLTLSPDKKSFSTQVTAPGAGPLTANLILTDLAGNSATFNGQITVTLAPLTLSAISPQNGATLNSRTIPVSFTASRNLAQATVNGQPLSVSANTASGTYIVPSDGPAVLSLAATATDGGQAAQTVNVTVSTARPLTLKSISPAPGSTVTGLTIPVSGQASNPLSSATINGISLTISTTDPTMFSGQITVPALGTYPVSLTLTDTSKNTITVSGQITVVAGAPALALTNLNPAEWFDCAGSDVPGLWPGKPDPCLNRSKRPGTYNRP